MASASNHDMQIPSDLLNAVNTVRPTCKFFQRGLCKAGGACKLYHRSGTNTSHLLPRVSIYDTADGPRIQIRPPLAQMVAAFWADIKMENPLGPCRRVQGTPIIEFQLVEGRMSLPQENVCSRAHLASYADVDVRKGHDLHFHEKRKIGASYGKVAFPSLLGHGTGCAEGLSILKDGYIYPVEGIAGKGVYAFEVELNDQGKLDDTQLSKIWKKSASGGYSKGCVFVLRVTECCLINGNWAYDLPPGALAFKVQVGNGRVQFAAHQSTLAYESVLFHEDSLVELLGKYMDKCN